MTQTKWYVSSGDLNTIILGSDAMDAAVKALKRASLKAKPPAIGLIFGVSQHTFEVENYSDDDLFIHSMHVVNKANLAHIYRISEEDIKEYIRELNIDTLVADAEEADDEDAE